MKKIKNILSSVIITLLFFGCDAEQASQDIEEVGSTDRYPTPTFTLSGGDTTFNEQGEPEFVYDIVLDKTINRPVDFSFIIVGGTATEHEDYDLFNATVPAYNTTAQMKVVIYNDTDVEGTETLQLKIESGPSLANKYLVHPDTQYPPLLDLTIEDYVFCFWTLEMSDTYGDGWNGGYIEITSEGVTTQYANEDLDGYVVLLETQILDIAITDGADYTISYISGGGTGAGPGWESENYYKLTSPDGTVWEDGTQNYTGVITEGLITSGTNNCL